MSLSSLRFSLVTLFCNLTLFCCNLSTSFAQCPALPFQCIISCFSALICASSSFFISVILLYNLEFSSFNASICNRFLFKSIFSFCNLYLSSNHSQQMQRIMSRFPSIKPYAHTKK
eukprot:217277_1